MFPTKVKRTNILAWAISKNVQLTAYSNSVNNKHNNNLMVVVPNPSTVVGTTQTLLPKQFADDWDHEITVINSEPKIQEG